MTDKTAAYDASDPEQVSRARKKAGRKQYESDEVLGMIMSQPNGRRWIMELVNFVNPLGTPIAPGDPHATYYNFGAQQVGKKLISDLLRVCPEMYLKMLREAKISDAEQETQKA